MADDKPMRLTEIEQCKGRRLRKLILYADEMILLWFDDNTFFTVYNGHDYDGSVMLEYGTSSYEDILKEYYYNPDGEFITNEAAEASRKQQQETSVREKREQDRKLYEELKKQFG